MVHYRQSP